MSAILSVIDAVVNTLWQAVAVAALVWLALKFAPRMNAATRHAIWWATLGVILVLPLAPRVVRTMRSHPSPRASTVATSEPENNAPTIDVEPVIITVTPESTAKWPLAIFAVWAAILLYRLAQIGRSYFYLRSVKRRATISKLPLPAIPRHASVLLSHDIASPMAVGFLRPAVLLPQSLLGEISEQDRGHILLHESAHLARYDDWINLAMRVLGGALALHPVAIWILRRIEREREMICDDWVVARTGAARPYAASLAHLFELRHPARDEALASGIFGRHSHLGDRIELLLRHGRTFSSQASPKRVATSALALGALLLAGSLAPRWIAFAQQPAPLKFEVTSITPGDSNDQRVGIHVQPGGRFTTTNATLRILISEAYDVPRGQISGGPRWLDSDNFNIEAKMDSATPLPPGPAGFPQFRTMIQSLLEDRFKLSVHRETKEEQVYDLIVSKGGHKLKDAESSKGLRMGIGQLTGMGAAVSQLTRAVSQRTGRPVIDKTGLTGIYDFELTFRPESGPGVTTGADVPVSDPNTPSIFTALQEQLGLQLKSDKGPVEYLIVDHAEKPDAN